RLHRRLGAAVRRPAGSRGAAVDLRGRRRHLDLGRPAQVRLCPQGHLAAAAPHAGAAEGAVLRLGGMAGLHDAELDDAVDQVGRGGYVQPQMSYAGTPPTIHLSVSAATGAHVREFLAVLGESVAAARASGPVQVDPGVVAFIEALDPDALSDEDFDGLLAASG